MGTTDPKRVILSAAKNLNLSHDVEILRFAQDDRVGDSTPWFHFFSGFFRGDAFPGLSRFHSK